MRKAVILVEGQTEQIFIQELIQKKAENLKLVVDCKRLNGGKKFPVIEIEVSRTGGDPADADLYFLILDCSSDGRVISSLAERYKRFVETGYQEIIVVRDVAPDVTLKDKPRLENGISKTLEEIVSKVEGATVMPTLVLATMEVEAWFLAEFSHFFRLDSSLTPAALAGLGFDTTGNVENITEPASLLTSIYESVGATYDKSKGSVEQVVQLLDLSAYCGDIPARVLSITPLITSLHRFIAPISSGP